MWDLSIHNLEVSLLLLSEKLVLNIDFRTRAKL